MCKPHLRSWKNAEQANALFKACTTEDLIKLLQEIGAALQRGKHMVEQKLLSLPKARWNKDTTCGDTKQIWPNMNICGLKCTLNHSRDSRRLDSGCLRQQTKNIAQQRRLLKQQRRNKRDNRKRILKHPEFDDKTCLVKGDLRKIRIFMKHLG